MTTPTFFCGIRQIRVRLGQKACGLNDNQGNKAAQRQPAVAVNKDGVVGVIWHDRRNGTADEHRKDLSNECSEVFFSASLDGGRTFLPNVRVSSTQSCPDVAGNRIPAFGAGSQSVFERFTTGGDYKGLATAHDGRFHALWADSRTGVFQLWTSIITVRNCWARHVAVKTTAKNATLLNTLNTALDISLLRCRFRRLLTWTVPYSQSPTFI